ncbi:hypothetical protein L202_06655 [Cryptococcus amylolentus CBS 6039]|uniref:Uncharacterized protein n=2 Tax=Cryptococcus amylolentus TaxID=104669 RepID=A0A1E3HGQ4_9TREE|nr:hypothetical protein L202_06655 [Cryptococcus amylolentus CBS 6039]ODN75530.1 hypothetical protein L202_06655 [Cryptococcus amylolentus CBS 6039]ODO03236.1 hypothetical protein I350_06081 [Cryptococcus amylolentus CBS 6273]
MSGQNIPEDDSDPQIVIFETVTPLLSRDEALQIIEDAFREFDTTTGNREEYAGPENTESPLSLNEESFPMPSLNPDDPTPLAEQLSRLTAETNDTLRNRDPEMTLEQRSRCVLSAVRSELEQRTGHSDFILDLKIDDHRDPDWVQGDSSFEGEAITEGTVSVARLVPVEEGDTANPASEDDDTAGNGQ